MTSVSFDAGWTVSPVDREAPVPVTLPHDAMIHEPRDPKAASWAHGGYFPGGRYRYRKTWTPAAQLAGKQVSLRFEGVYHHSRVLLDGHEVGGAVGGYREFEVRLDPHLRFGEPHEIEVLVDNAETPSARWYTGSGIYRPVSLIVRDPIHVEPDGLAFHTLRLGDSAQASVTLALANPDRQPLTVEVVLRHGHASVAEGTAETSGTDASVVLDIADPRAWSARQPNRYDLDVRVAAAGRPVDRRTARVGLRTVALDPRQGLLVNGLPVLLRGANIHSDQGVLGAATFAAAERRRVRILKDAGFNAVRSAHNPASRALLEACDELGVYVMDELFDGWYDHKTDCDDAERFHTEWSTEAASMVAKDRLSPSVLMYSIGNENGEALTPEGRDTAALVVAELRRLDPERLVTIGVNLVAATFAGVSKAYARRAEQEGAVAKSAPDMTSTSLNLISNRFGTLAKVLPRLRAADRATEELFGLVDVAGYNYGTARYALDAALHPDRIMVGTESMPGDIGRIWPLVEQLPTLIGDFMWAGWDYLGEAGGGSWAYGTRSAPYLKAYPQLTSGTGVFDITGVPGAPLFLAQAAWGRLDGPAITVRPVDVAGQPAAKTAWRATDAVPSWSWRGLDGNPTQLEIYSADDEVEVLVNGCSLGRRPAGRRHGFVARYPTRYEPGTVEAVAYRDGHETSRTSLRSAGELRLRLTAEQDSLTANGVDLAFVRIELADDDGVVDSATSDLVSVQLDGPATLAGLGSGAPATEESFSDAEHTTFRGRALAVVRSGTTAGRVTVTVTSEHHGRASVGLDLEPMPDVSC